jgi:beta-glucosidase-like glycosyl hydrolase
VLFQRHRGRHRDDDDVAHRLPVGRDGLVPASFDGRIVREMLRGELGYEGVVITDALEMAGARWYASERSGMVSGGNERSLLAGADLLLHTRPIPEQVQVEHGTEPVMSLNVMETIVRTLEKCDRARIDEKLAEAASESERCATCLSILDASFARGGARARAANRSLIRPRRAGRIELTAYPPVPAVSNRRGAVLTGWSNWSRFESPRPTRCAPWN